VGNPPAFQLYSNDFFVDTITWELDELGLYARLLFVEWSNGPLPNDHKKLAKIAGISPKKFSNLFQICSSKFVLNGDGNLINVRMEEARVKQTKYSESRKEIAKARWEKSDTQAMHMHEHTDMHTGCSSSSSSSLKKKERNIKKEKAQVPDGKPPYDFLESLKKNPAYQHINFEIELAKMDAWFLIPKNAKRRKTPTFILNWLNKIEAPVNGTSTQPRLGLSPDEEKFLNEQEERERG
jgi:uncharacterized protein YdaU (DUF1376 family)